MLALRMVGVTRILLSEVDPARRMIEQLRAATVDPEHADLPEAVAAAFGGLANAAIDAVGITPTIRAALEGTRLGATIVLVGMGSPELTLPAFLVSTGAVTCLLAEVSQRTGDR